MLHWLVAVLGLAAVAPERPAEPGSEVDRLLGSCRRSANFEGVKFACDGFVATVADHPGVPAADALRIHLGSVKALGRETTSSASSLQVGDRAWQGIAFAARGSDGEARLEGRAYAQGVRPGTTRLVSCMTFSGRPADRCLAVLPALAASGPGPHRPPPVEPSFLGRKVPIPDGCQAANASEEAFRIACGESASFRFQRLDSAETMGRAVSVLRQQLLRNVPGAAEGKERPCRIGGVAARCAVVTAGAGASQVLIVFGAAMVDGVPVSVQCAQQAVPGGVHPACAGVLDFQ